MNQLGEHLRFETARIAEESSLRRELDAAREAANVATLRADLAEAKLGEAAAEVGRLRAERDEARNAARYCFQSARADGVPMAYECERWPWLDNSGTAAVGGE